MGRSTTFLVTLVLIGTIATTAQAQTYARQAAALRVLPTATAKVVDRVDANQSLKVEESKNGWVHVRMGST